MKWAEGESMELEWEIIGSTGVVSYTYFVDFGYSIEFGRLCIVVSAGFMATSVLCFLSLARAYRVFVQAGCCLVKYEW